MRIVSTRRELDEFKKRYRWMAIFAFSIFLILMSRAIQLQVIDQSMYADEALDNITKTVSLPATRGILRDTNGRIVATNRPSVDVYVVPQLFERADQLNRFSELMGQTPEEKRRLVERLAKIKPSRRTHQIEIYTDIRRDQVASLATHASELVGVSTVSSPIRTYPFGSLGAHVIGYLNEVNADDLARNTTGNYRAGDRMGRSGLERAWEGILRGTRGVRKEVVDVSGESRLNTGVRRIARERRDPIPGRDLVLSLDMNLMAIIDRAFRGHPSGAAAVVDIRTGRVRALYSKPSYDLNKMGAGLSQQDVDTMNNDPFRPLIDKTLYETYFPGSIFKPITAIAAVQDGIWDPATHVTCTGSYQLGNRSFGCLQVHGDVDLKQALTRSCNTYFYELATHIGIDRLAKYANEFGLGEPTGLGINAEASGFIPNKAWYEQQYNNRFQLGFTLNEAIGQGNTKVTLLQLAMMYVGLSGQGTLFYPQLVERVVAPDGRTLEEFPPRIKRQSQVSAELLSYVREGLLGVVNDPTGTAYDAHIEGGVLVAGKTGTAQVQRSARANTPEGWYGNRAHAWFAGFAPAGDPQIAVIVLVEHGGGGGRNAAPIGMEVIQNHLGGPRTATPARPGATTPQRTGARAQNKASRRHR